MREYRASGYRWLAVSASIALAISVTATVALAATSMSATLFANVSNPVDIKNTGDTRMFIVSQDGQIFVFDSTGGSLGTFVDIDDRVISGGEQGLLGLVFHPNYASNGFFYVNYTRDPDNTMSGEPGEGDTRISRFTRMGAAGSNVADPSSEFVILDIPQPFANHNAGDLAFGPDGKLWIAMGDGGAGCDPGDRSQDGNELLGKMLRIDVDAASPYGIPSDNPYVGPDGIRDEIWSFGLRNPFRFSFDRSTGDLWIADVGQNSWEEVDFRPASSTGGENYGWDCREGLHDASAAAPEGSSCSTTAACTGPFVDPIHEYPHTGGRCSITGGYIYRGPTYTSLINGYYFFADYCSGDLYALSAGSCPGTYTLHSYGTPVGSPSSFGESNTGELFMASLGGAVYKLQASGTPDVIPPCVTCSATPLTSCREPAATKAKILIKNPSDDGKDKLIWKWLKGDITPKTAFGNPDPFDYTFCIYAGTAQDVVAQATIPGGASCPTCWTETATGFKYNAPGAGIEKILLKSGDVAGKAKIVLKGKGDPLPDLPSVPVTLPILVQLSNSDGQCWEASYSAEIKNENDLFKAKGD